MSDYDGSGLDLYDLEVSSQGESESAKRRLYAWNTEYRNVSTVNRARAERMAKTLKTIEHKMNDLREKFGSPSTFGAYLLRVADAIGATKIVMPSASKTTSGGYSYDDHDHRVMDLYEGASVVDGIVNAWATENGREEPVAVNGE